MESGGPGGSALFSMLGHKGDLLFLHFREDLEDLNRAEMAVSSLRLSEFLEPTTSLCVGRGTRPSTTQPSSCTTRCFPRESCPTARTGLPAYGSEPRRRPWLWPRRLDPPVPPHKYLCFYPMDKKAGRGPELVHRPD